MNLNNTKQIRTYGLRHWRLVAGRWSIRNFVEVPDWTVGEVGD